MTEEQKKALIDQYLGKWVSRKLFCLCLGVGLEVSGHLSSNMMILMATYIGVQAGIDVVKVWQSLK